MLVRRVNGSSNCNYCAMLVRRVSSNVVVSRASSSSSSSSCSSSNIGSQMID